MREACSRYGRVIYLLHDDLIADERIAALRAGLGSPDAQSLNVAFLDGARLTLAELRASVEALPFLGERRLVVVRRLFSSGARPDGTDGGTPRRGKSESGREQEFLTYLPAVPPTADLVLVEAPELGTGHPVAKLVSRLGGEVQLTGMPRWDELARWIERRVRAKGGSIEQAATEELTALPMADLRQLDLTLDALLTYADGMTVRLADVHALVPQSREATVFDLVDAVGARDRRGALEAYRRLLGDNASPVYILVMLTRQVRLLLLAQVALEKGDDLATALKVHPRVAQKLARQARVFGPARCVAAFERLAEVDQSIKTGEAEEELAVELLIVDLTEDPPRHPDRGRQSLS